MFFMCRPGRDDYPPSGHAFQPVEVRLQVFYLLLSIKYDERVEFRFSGIYRPCSQRGVDAVGIAMRYLDAGAKDRAIDWLYKAYESRDPWLAYIGLPLWDPLRGDPRFQALLRRIGLPLDEKK